MPRPSRRPGSRGRPRPASDRFDTDRSTDSGCSKVTSRPPKDEEESRRKFLEQWERCVVHQNQRISLPPAPRASDEGGWTSSEFIPEEPMGNGEFVQTDTDHPSSIGNPEVGGWYG